MSKLIPHKIILASASPRRKYLLEHLGIEFKQQPVDVDESFHEGESPEQAAIRIAEMKASGAAGYIQNHEIVLAADTIVVHEGNIIGKPKNTADAKKYLKKLSAETHDVLTGVCLLSKSRKKSFCVRTKVSMEALDTQEIDFYLDQWDALDKAGAYGIQDWIGWAKVSCIQGSYSNVMGLPAAEVYKALREF